MLARPALRDYRSWILDSRRWTHYRPRTGDVVVATYPKSGTTWTQRIVNLLIFQSPDPRPVDQVSPWIDRRIPAPINEVIATIEAQTHRRALKSHLPLDGLPIYDEVKYIHVGRDGRDTVLSFHNHGTGFKDRILQAFDAVGLADETIARTYPRIPLDAAEYFARWLREGSIAGQTDGYQSPSYFDLEQTYWDERHRGNFLFVHYNDLKADLDAEMRRIASFLSIEVAESTWPGLVAAAGFGIMKQQGAALMPGVTAMFNDGEDRFFNKGENGRWKGIFREEDLALYDTLLAQLPAGCARWLETGRRGAGDPRDSQD